MRAVPWAVALAVVVVRVLTPPGLVAAQSQGTAQNVRARVGAHGGAATLRNVRAVLPATSAAGAGYLALGVGLIPIPADVAAAAGDTGIVISVSPAPRGPLVLTILPSEADLAAARGDPARLAIYDVATRRAYGCRPAGAQITCAAPGVGVYLLASVADAEFLPEVERSAPADRERGRIPLAAASGVAVALLGASLWFWQRRSVGE